MIGPSAISLSIRYDAATNNVTVTGLTPGAYYEMRLYMRTWASTGDNRTQQFQAFIGNSATPQSTWIANEDNATSGPDTAWNSVVAANGGFVAGTTAWAMGYVYQADAAGKFTIRATSQGGGTLHVYGLTNQVAVQPPGAVNLPNTNIIVTATSTLNLATGSTNNNLGSLTLLNNGTALSLGNATNITFNGIASTGAGNSIGNGTGTPTIGLTAGSNIAVTGDLSIGSVIGDTAAATALSKTGAGTLTLTGTDTYTGTTTVSAGKLLVNGTLASPGGDVTAISGTTLGGSGTVARNVVVNSAAILAPGNSAAALGTHDLLLNSGANFNVEINGATPVSQYDQAVVTGAVNLNADNVASGGAVLNVTLGYLPVGMTQFTIIDNDSTDFVTGTFVGLAEGATFVVSGYRLKITYAGGLDSNDVVLTVVPNVTSVTPLAGPTTGGTLVTVNGTGFTAATGVTFGGVAGTSVTLDGSTPDLKLTAVSPAAAGPGAVDVVVSNAVGSSATGGGQFTYNPGNPVVSAVEINGGANITTSVTNTSVSLAGVKQIVKQALVTFDQAVTLDAGAFTVTTRTTSVSVAHGVSPNTAAISVSFAATNASNSQYLLTFSGPGTHDGGIIKDGIYDLTTVASKVHGSNGNLAANRTDVFLDLYGTVDTGNIYSPTPGDGLSDVFVNGGGFAGFVDAFNSRSDTDPGPTHYNVGYDYNLDGFINGADFAAFVQTFNVEWKY